MAQTAPLDPARPDPAHPDPWQAIGSEADALIAREPLLGDLLARVVFGSQTLEAALAARLADVLQGADISSQALAGLFGQTMANQPAIAAAASTDLQAVRDRDPACATYLHAILNLKGFQALQAHRIAHQLWTEGRMELAAWLSYRISLVLGPDIHPAARVGAGIMLDHGTGVVIGETAIIEDGVSIMQNVTLGGTGKIVGDRHPKVRHGVMIGAGAKILGNIEIGAFSKIAAGSVVLKSVPPGCTVAGVPAQIVRIHGTAQVPAETMDQSI